jgi:hypothetical protein
MTGELVKFPIGRVVDCRFVKQANGPSEEAEEIDREWWSVTQALTALRRQEQSLDDALPSRHQKHDGRTVRCVARQDR